MPATAQTTLLLLENELEKKLSQVPLELHTVLELFGEDNTFLGTSVFFNKEHPFDDLASTPTSTVTTQSDAILSATSKNIYLTTQITQEEQEDIRAKLMNLVMQPPGQLDSESELYLEQQLGELLGFQVSSNLDGFSLLYNTGKIKSLPHVKTNPNDTISSHEYPYAGLKSSRASYGWFLENGSVNEASQRIEKYYCSLPLYYYPEWSEKSQQMKKWYKYRKMLIVNPFEGMAVVTAVATIGPAIPTRYQFGASPEAVIEGKLWSSQALGRVLVLFIDDPQNSVPLGPIKLLNTTV